MKELALFDFDGTITTRDTLLEIIKYQKGASSFYFGMFLLSPVLILSKLKLVKNWKAKELVLSYFFRGTPYSLFQRKCDEFATHVLPSLQRKEALQKMDYHLSKNHRIVVVSASAYNWIQEWCREKNIELIATQLEVKNDKITGKLQSLNCNGIEKVNRINAFLNLNEFEQIYAYGDSGGDKPMLALAHHAFYRKF